jgi:hypothetical protein
MRDMFDGVGVSIVANTALFTGLDFGQWIADTLSLSTLPANLIAALIATAFGLAVTAIARLAKRVRPSVLAAVAAAPRTIEADRVPLPLPVTFRRSLPVYPRTARR